VADQAVQDAAVGRPSVEQRGLDVTRKADAVERLLHRSVDQRGQHREQPDGEGVVGVEPRQLGGDELHRAPAHERVGQQLIGPWAAPGQRDDERPPAGHALADERDRLADRADLAPAREEGRVGVAEQAVAELEVAGDERLEAVEVEVGGEQLAGGGHGAELHGRALAQLGQRAERALEAGRARGDAGLEDVEAVDAHGVDLHSRREERLDSRGDRGGVETADVEADEADRCEPVHDLGRNRVDGGEDVAQRGEAVDGGDDLVMVAVPASTCRTTRSGATGRRSRRSSSAGATVR
jgi:hypothetical protein